MTADTADNYCSAEDILAEVVVVAGPAIAVACKAVEVMRLVLVEWLVLEGMVSMIVVRDMAVVLIQVEEEFLVLAEVGRRESFVVVLVSKQLADQMPNERTCSYCRGVVQ